MTVVTATSTPDRKLTRADWDAMPEHRYKTELLDGVVVEAFGRGPDMTMPSVAHQEMLSELNDLVKRAAPDGWKVLFAPIDVHISDTVILEPDLVAAPRELFLPRGLEQPPSLVVEVLSPSTRSRDLVKKFTWFRDFGIEHVWFADPDEPSVAVWELVDGHYVEVGEAVGDQTVVVERPFAAEINPRRLLDG